MRVIQEQGRMDSTTHNQWPEWINSGLAFFGMLIGWIWHAARLSTKVDMLQHKLDKHLEDEEGWWRENREAHESVAEKITSLREDMAAIHGVPGLHHRSHRRREE